MVDFFLKHLRVLFVSALLLAPFGFFLAWGRRAHPPDPVGRVLIALSAPLQVGVRAVVEGTSSLFHHYVSLRGVQVDNDTLKVENARLRSEVSGYAETRAENERLKRLLAFSDANPGIKTPARVVGVIPDPLRQWVRIDRGDQDGIKPGMAVVTPDGVAGQVMRTVATASDVMLLTDASSRVGVRVQRTRSRATATGTGEAMLKLENALRSEPLEDGDQLITSGTDGVYPPGLMVGKVTGLQRGAGGMFWAASVAPAVDTTRLEDVFVMPAPLEGVTSDLARSPPLRPEGRR